MKLHVVIVLCTCLVYTNAAPANIPFYDALQINMTEYFNDFKQHPNDYINGVGDQFVDDVLNICNTFQNETFALTNLYEMVSIVLKLKICKAISTKILSQMAVLFQVKALSTDLRKKDNSKIDEHDVHDFAIADYMAKGSYKFLHEIKFMK